MEAAGSNNEVNLRFYQALTEILAEKSFDKITVKELADRSGFSRKTFYYHYGNTVEVLDAHHENQRQNTVAFANANSFDSDPSVIPTLIGDALRNPSERSCAIAIVFHAIGDFTHYEELFVKRLCDSWVERYDIDRGVPELYASAVVAAISRLYREWITMQRPLSIEEVSELLEHLLEGAFASLSAIEKSSSFKRH